MPLYHKTIGQGPDLVLLHGWGFNSDIWLPMATPLSEQYTVHCYDLPGFGRSRHVALAPDLNELIEVLLPLLPQNASYVGWSLGGLLAMAIAASFPLRVKSLVTIGSSPCFLQNENWNGVSPDFFNSFYSLMLQDAQKGLKQFARLMLTTRKDQRQFSSSVLQMMHHDSATDLNALMTGLTLLKNSDLRNDLQNLRCPNVHIVGQLDPLTKENLSLQQIQIPDAGHIPLLTHKEQLLSHLLEFLDENR